MAKKAKAKKLNGLSWPNRKKSPASAAGNMARLPCT